MTKCSRGFQYVGKKCVPTQATKREIRKEWKMWKKKNPSSIDEGSRLWDAVHNPYAETMPFVNNIKEKYPKMTMAQLYDIVID